MDNQTKHYPSVYIILLNWNNSEETINCLSSLEKIIYNNFKVVIVDNGSEDDSIEKINKFYQEQDGMYEMEIIENKENKGFAGGNNTGFEIAKKDNADYVLVLNNDTKVDPLFLNEMMELAQSNEKIGVVGSTIYFYDDRDVIWFGGNTELKWKKMDQMIATACDFYKKELPPEVPPIKVNFISGACMLIKKEALEKVGGFDERFFLYFEDADLNFQIESAGYDLYWQPKARIWHKVSATTLPKLGSPRLHYYHVRNIMILTSKHGPSWANIYKHYWATKVILKQVLKIIIGIKRDISKARLRGALDYYRKRFGKYEKNYPEEK